MRDEVYARATMNSSTAVMIWAGVVLAAMSGAAAPARGGEDDRQDLPRVLFLTHSAGFQHSCIKRKSPEELSMAENQLVEAAAGKLRVDATKDCGTITAGNLGRYQAVVFYTSGELPISEENRQALLAWIRDGGAFVGIHPATDTFYKFPEYGRMIGGYFDGHPWHQTVRIKVEDSRHPATRHLGESFEIRDEIYQFKNFLRDELQVLLVLDNDSVDVNKSKHAEKYFPVAWCREYGRGRVFYTSLGHREEVWRDQRFLTHVIGGIRWAMRQEDAHE
jgi:type 1 glutamine amidotransferase